jgi:predicted nucleic acid-binding protein
LSDALLLLLDTNHLGLAVRKGSPVAKRIEASRKAGDRVETCLPVLFELQAGSRQVSSPDKYQRDGTHLLKQLRIWPLELTTTLIYGDNHAELKEMGRAASSVDL